MKSTLIQNDNTHTTFVQLNAFACTACWKCIEACPNKVIDKSFLYVADTLVHEQVLMYDADKCTGCTKCMQACKFDAISIYKQ
jgi:Fe-S-cluster-containing hydrogenase component 2